MLSDFPRPRARRRESAISFVVTAQDPFAAPDQKPLQGARDMPAVLDRPHPFAVKPPRPHDQPGKALGADLNRLLAHHLAGRRRDRGDRVRALVGVRTEHDH
jgi:hypothetical protein